MTTATLAAMRRLARGAVTDPLTVWTARMIAAQTGDGHQEAAVAMAIRGWMFSHVVYVHDPIDRELLSPPSAMLQQVRAYGQVGMDCDETAILGAALANAVGLSVKFRAARMTGDRYFSHVFAVVPTPQGDVSLDLQTPPAGVTIAATYDYDV